MPFLSVSFANFRNLRNGPIDLLAGEVFFVGENGQGKSNILEALYYTAYGNSFRTHTDSQLIKHGENAFSLKAMFRCENGHTDVVSVLYQNGKKRIEKNAKRIADRKEMVNTIPCVLFCHDDLDFATGEPERRRFFIDQSLSMYDVLYIDILRRYKKILKSRNQLLKDRQTDMLDVYDQHLVQHGLEIQEKRRNAVFTFNRIFTPLYEKVTGISGVSIQYEPSWKNGSDNYLPSAEEVCFHMKKRREADCAVCTTLSGPHRDRIYFIRGEMPFIPIASTGQRRLTAVLLRIAQAVFYTEITGKKPVLLMDDVLLELDPVKRQSVIALLPAHDQLFCTFLPGEPYDYYKTPNTRIYTIHEGVWNE